VGGKGKNEQATKRVIGGKKETNQVAAFKLDRGGGKTAPPDERTTSPEKTACEGFGTGTAVTTPQKRTDRSTPNHPNTRTIAKATRAWPK